jgi:hypothetical protein
MHNEDLEMQRLLSSLNERLSRIESRLDYFEHHHLIHHHRNNLPPRHGEEESAIETLARIAEKVSGMSTRIESLFELSTQIAQGVGAGRVLLGKHVNGGCNGQLEIQVENTTLYIKCLGGTCTLREKIKDLL